MDKPILNRFKLAVTYLLDKKIVNSKKDLAISLGQSQSNFTEILGGRVKLSADLMQAFLGKYPINPMYLHYLSEDVDITTINDQSVDEDVVPKEGAKDDYFSPKNLDTLRLIKRLKVDTISDAERNNIADSLEQVIARLSDNVTKLMEENSMLKSDLLTSWTNK